MLFSHLDGLPSPVAVVCHDAGAANLILAWLERSDLKNILPVMAGPARQCWVDRFGFAAPEVAINDALQAASSLLSGTGWQSDVEHNARKHAADRGIPSVAVIDHWVNYRERFERQGLTVLPGRIWVTDDNALKLAAQAFDLPIELRPNTYLERQAALIGTLRVQGDILFVGEPVRSDWGRGEQGEFQALDYFLANRTAAGIAAEVAIRVRPHPSDEPGKYDEWIRKASDAPVRLDDHASLAEAMRPAEWVIGCQSYALIVAIAAGRKAISALPPWAPACSLMHPKLIQLSDAGQLAAHFASSKRLDVSNRN